MRLRQRTRTIAAAACLAAIATSALPATDEAEVLAIADLALDRISAEDPAGLSNPMI